RLHRNSGCGRAFDSPFSRDHGLVVDRIFYSDLTRQYIRCRSQHRLSDEKYQRSRPGVSVVPSKLAAFVYRVDLPLLPQMLNIGKKIHGKIMPADNLVSAYGL